MDLTADDAGRLLGEALSLCNMSASELNRALYSAACSYAENHGGDRDDIESYIASARRAYEETMNEQSSRTVLDGR